MKATRPLAVIAGVVAIAAVCIAGARPPGSEAAGVSDLVALFNDWRAFGRPPMLDGVPQYTAAAMSAQARALPEYQRRLAAINPRAWPVPQQVDYYIVEAEMSGLEFDHRVRRPWATNPAFYATVFPEQSDQPAREGPLAAGAAEIWSYTFPLSAAAAADLDARIRTIPRLLEQARANLTGGGRDLWVFGSRRIKQQSADLAALMPQLTGAPQVLKDDVRLAREATDAFAGWLEGQAPSRTGASGVGVENYDWYLKHVQLVPYTWHDEVAIMERELARAQAFLALEEERNAGLPQPQPVASAEEHARRFAAAVTEYMQFLESHHLMTVRDDMAPALQAKVGAYHAGPREFFAEVDYRDPEIMRTHGYHWFDLARMAHDPHPDPIRRGPLLFNIFNTRTEGHATGWEEMMLHAGMFDQRPRSRELIYVLLAERAARALGDLRMHANEFTLEQAAQFASANTPRGWLRLDAATVRDEQHLYLQQPAYGTSYITGKIQIERLMAERRQKSGTAFTMKQLMDDFNEAGLIPASLLRWELTGELPADVAAMLGR